MAQWLAGAMEPYWESLHCVHTPIESLQTGGRRGAEEATSIGALLIFGHSFPTRWSHRKNPNHPKGPSQPHLCFCLHAYQQIITSFYLVRA